MESYLSFAVALKHAFAEISLFIVFWGKQKNGIRDSDEKKCGTRDSREKGAGMPDQDPPFQTLACQTL